MIHASGSALICDFGSALVAATRLSLAAPTSELKGTCNHWAPELLSFDTDSGVSSKYTLASDMWAFGMTVYVSLRYHIWKFLL